MKPLQYDYNRLGIDFDVTDCINELALRTKLIISTQDTAVYHCSIPCTSMLCVYSCDINSMLRVLALFNESAGLTYTKF